MKFLKLTSLVVLGATTWFAGNVDAQRVISTRLNPRGGVDQIELHPRAAREAELGIQKGISDYQHKLNGTSPASKRVHFSALLGDTVVRDQPYFESRMTMLSKHPTSRAILLRVARKHGTTLRQLSDPYITKGEKVALDEVAKELAKTYRKAGDGAFGNALGYSTTEDLASMVASYRKTIERGVAEGDMEFRMYEIVEHVDALFAKKEFRAAVGSDEQAKALLARFRKALPGIDPARLIFISLATHDDSSLRKGYEMKRVFTSLQGAVERYLARDTGRKSDATRARVERLDQAIWGILH